MYPRQKSRTKVPSEGGMKALSVDTGMIGTAMTQHIDWALEGRMISATTANFPL